LAAKASNTKHTNECKKLKTAVPSFLPSNSECLECMRLDALPADKQPAFHSCLQFQFVFASRL
jgi:hypothetical protein